MVLGEDSWESLGLQGDQSWVFIGRTMLKLKLQYFGHLVQRVDSLEKTLMLEGLGAGGEGDDRGWDGWMASPTRWTWVWVNSGSWWWTGRPGVLQFMRSQRVGHNSAAELRYVAMDKWFKFSVPLLSPLENKDINNNNTYFVRLGVLKEQRYIRFMVHSL